MTDNRSKRKIRHKGRLSQIPIYLGKMFRMFIYLNDWKVIPMAAVISALVAYVIGQSMFVTMEGTLKSALALSCVCLWNGCFNSIQVVCRERDIVKREHRDGMHISSYVVAHMIYQAFLCLLQTIVTIVVSGVAGIKYPTVGLITPWFFIDFGITVFLITYAADMMSLFVSCLVKNTTSAMTIMPFLLIFQLIFSGSVFGLEGNMTKLTDLSIAKWGINSMCAQADYNSLKMVTPWNQIFKFRDVEIADTGIQPVKEITDYVIENNMIDDICYWMGSQNPIEEYETSIGNVLACWSSLATFAILFAVLAVIVLERIDKDKR